jgi:hypothetical protein
MAFFLFVIAANALQLRGLSSYNRRCIGAIAITDEPTLARYQGSGFAPVILFL